jgi:hypothetical protein
LFVVKEVDTKMIFFVLWVDIWWDLLKDQLGDQRGGEWMGADKNSSRRINSTYTPNSPPMIPTQTCQGRVVTIDLPTLGTSPNTTQSGSTRQEAKDLANCDRLGRTVHEKVLDHPWSTEDCPWIEDGPPVLSTRTSSAAPGQYRPSVTARRTVRARWTIRHYSVDRPSNMVQQNSNTPTDRTPRSQEDDEHARNPNLTDRPWTHGGQSVVREQHKQKHELEGKPSLGIHGSPKWLNRFHGSPKWLNRLRQDFGDKWSVSRRGYNHNLRAPNQPKCRESITNQAQPKI